MRFDFVRIIALIALCLHAAAPSMGAASFSGGLDVSSFICVTPGTVQSKAQTRMAERLSTLLEQNNEAPDLDNETCSHCIMAGSLILPNQVGSMAPRYRVEAQTFITFNAGLVRSPRGPPVGATGPPSLHLI